MPQPPRASIVVLTFNRRDEVLRTLACLRENVPQAPLIVVDNGSSDGTAEAVRERYPNVELVALRWNMGAAGRNLGVERVRTPYVAFCDDDCCWEPGSIELAADILDGAPAVAVVNARILVGEDGATDPTCELMAQSPLGRVPQGMLLLGFMAGASVMRVECFRQAGGYWPAFFIGGEEELLALDFAARGWQMVYAADVLTRHRPSVNRDARQRSQLLTRNALWTAWMRLPLHQALADTVRILREAPGPRHAWRALCDAGIGLADVLRNRRVVPPHVRRIRGLLRTSRAR